MYDLRRNPGSDFRQEYLCCTAAQGSVATDVFKVNWIMVKGCNLNAAKPSNQRGMGICTRTTISSRRLSTRWRSARYILFPHSPIANLYPLEPSPPSLLQPAKCAATASPTISCRILTHFHHPLRPHTRSLRYPMLRQSGDPVPAYKPHYAGFLGRLARHGICGCYPAYHLHQRAVLRASAMRRGYGFQWRCAITVPSS
ncbi:hypothetical protein K432DRAFT_129692 [Lepidopterella palustris CBS 459.81]|uniref:Uncharacterized protein n=1 Tax=Lepidopterella palustris CBS 459.81 TaxID=1314670 RepID=A0A8E2E481_9PEZI|nr:hypothetical protein K432DRAFT_129692 [Lepidopterella palustris CBS 459.81]